MMKMRTRNVIKLKPKNKLALISADGMNSKLLQEMFVRANYECKKYTDLDIGLNEIA